MLASFVAIKRMQKVCYGGCCVDDNWVASSFAVRSLLVPTSSTSTARKRSWLLNWTVGVMQMRVRRRTMRSEVHLYKKQESKSFDSGIIRSYKKQKRYCRRSGTHCTLTHPHPNPLPPAGEGVVMTTEKELQLKSDAPIHVCFDRWHANFAPDGEAILDKSDRNSVFVTQKKRRNFRQIRRKSQQ